MNNNFHEDSVPGNPLKSHLYHEREYEERKSVHQITPENRISRS